MGYRLPMLMTHEVPRRLCHRFGREAVLAHHIDVAAWVASHGPPRSVADADAAYPPRETSSWRNAHRTTLSLVLEGSSCNCSGHASAGQSWLQQILHRQLRRNLQLRLWAADLDGSPWPTDPQDPGGRPLRPAVRDGQVIGAYGCGSNGTDDGGSMSADWCWPLRARLGALRAADAPPQPAAVAGN